MNMYIPYMTNCYNLKRLKFDFRDDLQTTYHCDFHIQILKAI